MNPKILPTLEYVDMIKGVKSRIAESIIVAEYEGVSNRHIKQELQILNTWIKNYIDINYNE